jgi:outer membrane protein OmpA-like peptidoglycan-associated protein
MTLKSAISAAALLLCISFTGLAQEQTVRDSAELARRQLDSLRRKSPSVGTNLFYWGSATPNAHFWIPVGDNITLGMVGGLKPWPRWLPWDNDPKVDSKWRHFAIVPGLRFWPKYNYSGLWLGADLLWTHYNVGGVTFPLGLYPEVRENRLQGDFFGLGINIGYSWWLSKHLRLEAEVGVAAGYNTADRYQCAWCGANLGKTSGPAIVPKLGLNLAYNFFKEKAIEPVETITEPLDTLKRPDPVDPPTEFVAALPLVADWKGVAGQLEKDHPVLRPSSEYQPYTPDRILRKEESPLYVFFELDKSKLLREFDEPTARGKAAHRNNGPVLDEIMDITSKILADTTSSVTKIQIIGLASVEGRPGHNQDLSDSRALALQRYIQQRLPVKDDMFDTVGGGAAWTEFRDEINDLILQGGGAGLTTQELQSVIDIIDSEPSPARREARLKKLGGGRIYKLLRENVLGDQRNSGYLRIYYDYVPDESAREINDGIRLLEQKDYAAALKALEAKRDDSRSHNALAVALFYNGREAEAHDMLRQAAADGDESAERNLMQLQRIMEQRAAYEQYLRDMEEYAHLRYGR